MRVHISPDASAVEFAVKLLQIDGGRGANFQIWKIKPLFEDETVWRTFLRNVIARGFQEWKTANDGADHPWEFSVSVALIGELLPNAYSSQSDADKCFLSMSMVVDQIEERAKLLRVPEEITDGETRGDIRDALNDIEDLFRKHLAVIQTSKEAEKLLKSPGLSPVFKTIILHRLVNIDPERVMGLLAARA